MQGGSASSGKYERRRIDGDHRRRSRTKTMAWRRCRASRGAWLGGEEEGVAAELLSSAEGRGVAGDGCYGVRRRWWCSAVRERARERREELRESEREQGRAWRRSRPSRRGGEGQAGRRAGGVARWRARAPGTLPSLCRGRRRQRREAGWAACWLGQPAGWAAQWRSPGKLLLL